MTVEVSVTFETEKGPEVTRYVNGVFLLEARHGLIKCTTVRESD